MKYLYSLLGLALLISCNNTTELGKSSAEDYTSDFKGFPKKIQIVRVDQLPKDLDKFDWESHLNKSEIIFLDKKNRVVERTSHRIYSKYTVQYDKNGLKTQTTEIDMDNKKIISYFTYNDEKQIEEIKKNDQSSYTYYYDLNGNCTSINHHNYKQLDGTKVYMTTTAYKYDKKNRVIFEKYDDYPPTKISYKKNTIIREETSIGKEGSLFIENFYKNNNLKSQKKYRIVEGEKDIVEEIFYKYNRYGDLILRETKGGIYDGEIFKYVYQYDTEKNWITKITYKNGELWGTDILKIEYHKRMYFGILP